MFPKKYIIAVLFSKLMTVSSLVSYLILTLGCGKLGLKYSGKEKEKINTKEHIFQTNKVNQLRYYSFLKFIDINEADDSFALHDFCRNINLYKAKLLNLYNLKPPGTYIMSIDNFIDNHIESLKMLDKQGHNPLHCLVQSSSIKEKYAIKILKRMLKATDNVNQSTSYGTMALHFVARLGYEKAVKLLLNDPRIDVNIKNEYHSTPLHLAAEHSHVNVVTILIKDPRTQIDPKDKDGKRPLDLAKTEKIVATLAGFL